MKTLLLIVCIAFLNSSFSQKIFYQDICNCGVTGAGFSTALGSGSGSINVNIDPNSTIKKAFLFAQRFGLANDTSILFNNTLHFFNSQNRISPELLCQGSFYALEQSLHAIDVTNEILPNQNNYLITIPNQNSCEACQYGNIYLLVIYENISLINTSISFYVNDKNDAYSCSYLIDTLNPINSFSDVLFSVYSDRINDYDQFDGSVFSINNQQIGILKGTDNSNLNWSGGGVKGHFYFQNSTIYGLDDDDPFLPFGGSNGIKNLNQFNFVNSINWNIKWESFVPPYNIFSGFFLAYTSPCASFPTTNSQDTTVCKGAYLQLSASGGVNYSWEPATGLSCANCPNPVVQTDSSQVYTVRIWNNDSCSVVRPIPVRVNQLPKFGSIASTASACAADNGKIVATAAAATTLPVSYSFNANPFQFSSTYTSTFSNLAAGTYPLSLKDGNGCVRDTAVVVSLNNNVNALFTASPTSGAHPLVVNFNNQSTNATNFAWKINGVSVGNNLPSYTFTSAGTYTVQLFAWNNNPNCIDSFSLQLFVYDTLLVQVPNVFTPNNDGTNETFSLQSNVPIVVEASIINRWGEIIFNITKTATSNNGSYTTELWDGKNATDSVYFYTLKCSYLNQIKKLEGFVSLVR